MREFAAQRATESHYDLAEGIVWDDRAQLVRWIDINRGVVLSGHLATDRITRARVVALGHPVGSLALADDGGLLIAIGKHLACIAPSGAVSVGPEIVTGQPTTRLNDGAVDQHGAFIVGSLTPGRDTGHEVLVRVQPNGDVEVLRRGVRLSNGVAFSPDGGRVFHVDTLARTVSSHSYGTAEFDQDELWTTVLDGSDLPSLPDGITVDADGMLWVALFGGGSVRRYSPDGRLLAAVRVPTPQVTRASFVGPDHDLLAITSAREGFEFHSADAGALFVADVGVSGLPAPRWAGSTTHPFWQQSTETTEVS